MEKIKHDKQYNDTKSYIQNIVTGNGYSEELKNEVSSYYEKLTPENAGYIHNKVKQICKNDTLWIYDKFRIILNNVMKILLLVGIIMCIIEYAIYDYGYVELLNRGIGIMFIYTGIFYYFSILFIECYG